MASQIKKTLCLCVSVFIKECSGIRNILFGAVFLDDKVVDDEVLALHGVLAHVVLQEFLHLVGLVEGDLL